MTLLTEQFEHVVFEIAKQSEHVVFEKRYESFELISVDIIINNLRALK